MFADLRSYIVASLFRRILEVSIEECIACQQSRVSPVLHAHQASGLLEKTTFFLDRIRSELLDNIEQVG